MLDRLKRIVVILINGGLVVYALRLLINGTVVVKDAFVGLNLIVLLGMVVVALYIGIVYGVYPLYHKMQKRTLFVIGVVAIIVGYQVMINDTERMIYASDIVRVFGVLTVWLGATGIITKTKAITDQKREKNLEIIEA